MNNSSLEENTLVHDHLWVKSLPENRNEIPGNSLVQKNSLSLSLNTKWYSPDFIFFLDGVYELLYTQNLIQYEIMMSVH